MLTNKQLVAIKMRDLINIVHDMDRDNAYQMRYDDLLKFCGLDEKELLRILRHWTNEGKLNFHGHVDDFGHVIHDEYICDAFKVSVPNTTALWKKYDRH
ncbi:MAG: hypothetical protein ABF899_04335 [Oenococcus sp.]|uniref:hypothetical protein n=1 Tax=Oenococcus sp. TaxID=1979414 RepID=UPI0039ECBC0B